MIHVTPSIVVFPLEAPDIVEQKKAISIMHCQNTWPSGYMSIVKWVFLILFLTFFYCCSVTVVPIFLHCSPLPFPPPLIQSSPNHCPCAWVLYTCFLTWPFSSFPQLSTSLLSSGYCQFVWISVPLALFCLLVCFVDYVPLIGEITWYLSLTTGLISFSIMLSSSIHAVSKGSSFFLSAAEYSVV